MKAIKLAALVLAVAISPIFASAHVDVMQITLQRGGTHQYEVAKIADMSFVDELQLPESTGDQINGHEYVDLGLPSGTKWATCNIGASSPAEDGSCFAWGELTTKSLYNIFEGTWCGKTYSQLLSKGVITDDGVLAPAYDVATKAWGPEWRMPTLAEMQELVDCCTWLWTTVDGMNGCIVVGPNGNCMFIPAAGNYHGFFNEHGRYWSATVNANDDRAATLYFDQATRFVTLDLFGTGIPVRAVVK